MKSTLPVLLVLACSAMARGETPAEPVKAAVERGLRRIEAGAASYIKNRQCFSCHHQAVAIHVLASARACGFDVEPAKLRHQIDFTLDTFKSKRERVAR